MKRTAYRSRHRGRSGGHRANTSRRRVLGRRVIGMASLLVVLGVLGLVTQSSTVALGALTGRNTNPSSTDDVPTLRDTSFEEDSPEGLGSAPWWTELGDTRASFTHAGGRTGSLYLGHWGPVPYRVETSQSVTGLPDGRYTASIWVESSGGQTAAYISLRGCGSADARTALPVSTDRWQQVSVSTTVTGGACTFSLVSDGPAKTWASFDDARLDLTARAKPHRTLPATAVFIGIVLALVAVAVSTVLVTRRALRPVSRLTQAVLRRATGGRWEQVEVHGHDDVAELTQSFNTMAAAVMHDEERQRRMVADIAHELRTPLSTVRSYLEALIDGVLPAEQAVFVSLHDEAMLQQRIIDDLQDLALAESGTLTYHKDEVSIPDLLRSCQQATTVKAAEAGVSLSVTVDSDAAVYADADRLRQVVGNLLSNALRHTEPGGSVILRCEAASGEARIWVADTGSGIASQDLPHIFERFWRAAGSRGVASGGSGLGLVIARQIITDHGGEITVRSRSGEGTTFTISLPLFTGGPQQSEYRRREAIRVGDAPSGGHLLHSESR